MKGFLRRKQTTSGNVAKDRLKLLLLSERMECSPQMIMMLRNDVIHTISKYVTIDEEHVVLQMTQMPRALSATIPLVSKKGRIDYLS